MRASPAGRSPLDLLLRERHGVLSTAHHALDGWPFGSVTPFALTVEGDPILFLSEIAEHARNLRQDPRASLLVQDREALDHPQAGARVTLLGRTVLLQGGEARPAQEAYLARFPEASSYSSAHGFDIWVLRVERVRWIEGFGSMGWLQSREWSALAAGRLQAPEERREEFDSGGGRS